MTGACEHGCGYALPCPGVADCVYWERGRYVGPTPTGLCPHGQPATVNCPAAPSALAERVAALRDEAHALSLDLRAARDAAPDGRKSGYRLANQRVEQAMAKLREAAGVSL